MLGRLLADYRFPFFFCFFYGPLAFWHFCFNPYYLVGLVRAIKKKKTYVQIYAKYL